MVAKRVKVVASSDGVGIGGFDALDIGWGVGLVCVVPHACGAGSV